MELPARPMERTLTLLPRWNQSRIEKLDPNRVAPKMEQVEPNR
jgi:hypothetical protein